MSATVSQFSPCRSLPIRGSRGGDGRALHRQLSWLIQRLARRGDLADIGQASLVGCIPRSSTRTSAARRQCRRRQKNRTLESVLAFTRFS